MADLNVSVAITGQSTLAVESTNAATASLARLEQQQRLAGASGGGYIVQVTKLSEAHEGLAKSAEHAEASESKLKDTFKENVTQAGEFALALIGIQVGQSILENLVSAMVEFPEKIDSARISFETFTGSAEQAATILSQIEGLSAKDPFHTDALLNVGRTLTALGTPAEEVAVRVQDIASAVAAVGGSDQDLQRVALTLSRVQEMGTITSRTMLQLTQEQVPGWQILETALGKNQAQLAEMLKTGQITSQVFLDAFHEWATTTAGEALAKQANTITGSLTILTNAAQIAAATALSPLTDQLEGVTREAAKLATSGDLQRWATEVKTANQQMIAGFDLFEPTMARARAQSTLLDASIKTLDGTFLLLKSGVNDATVALDAFLGTSPKWKLPDLGKTSGLFDAGEIKPFDAALKTTQADLDGTGQKADAAAKANDQLRMSASDTIQQLDAESAAVKGLGVAMVDLTGQADAANAAVARAASVARAETHDSVVQLEHMGSTLGTTYASVRTDGDYLAESTKKAASAIGSIGQQALAAIPGLAAFDNMMFGTSQQLAAVQLQIEERTLARMERRPARTLYQQEGLLQEQLKVDELQRQVEFGGALRGITGKRGVPIATGGKFRTGFQTGGSFEVPGDGGPDSTMVHFFATPGETVGVNGPGQGNTISLASLFGPGSIIIQNEAQAHAVGNRIGDAFAKLIAGAGTAPGKAHIQLAGVR